MDLFFKLEELKKLKRKGWLLRGIPNPESVAEHSFLSAVLAMLLADDSLDKDKCIKMALIHDISECIIGDYTPYDNITDEEKYKKEYEALKYLFENTEVGKEIISLWKEFEENKTKEAQFVRSVDKLELAIQGCIYYKRYKDKIDLEKFFEKVGKKIIDERVKKMYDILKENFLYK